MDHIKKFWGIWMGIVIVALFVVFVITSGSGSPIGALLTVDPVSAADHIFGSPTAKVVLIEYGDFECPACALYVPLVSQLEKDFSDTLAVVFRNFPLRGLHANADAAAQASEAAHLQGKFWEMHDKLYESQIEWEKKPDAKNIFTQYAGQLGLDTAKFTADMNSAAVKAIVDAAYSSATRSGLTGTPTFFLNGKQLSPTQTGSYESFKALIQAQIAK